jgi:hypothetical protein
MLTNELLAAIHSSEILRPYSSGVHAADQLPLFFPVNSFFIANTDISVQPGKHWVCFYKSFYGNRVCIDFFDSAGFGIRKYGVKWVNYIKYHSDFYKYNREIIQYPLSTYCGIHCLCFALLRIQGTAFKNIIYDFYSQNLCHNDHIAKTYVSHYINTNILQEVKSLQSCTDVLNYFN